VRRYLKQFEAHLPEAMPDERGPLRRVQPKIVLEVAFNAVMRSDRHGSGYALRFPHYPPP
jgi:DNA ligase-1